MQYTITQVNLCVYGPFVYFTVISLLNSKYLSVYRDIKTQSASSDSLHFQQHHKASIILPNHIKQLVFVFVFVFHPCCHIK